MHARADRHADLHPVTISHGYTQGFATEFDWTGTAFQERQAAGQTGALIGLALLFAYLFLVALYESWTLPLAVILVWFGLSQGLRPLSRLRSSATHAAHC